MKKLVRATILGASGYTGAGLYVLLMKHPGVEVVAVSAERSAGEMLSSIFPRLSEVGGERKLIPVDEAIEVEADVVFSCLPHKTAMDVVPALLDRGRTVIDLSADFRMDTAESYKKWYETEHVAAHLLPERVYGLPELYREQIRNAKLIACPGCYPTSVILPLAPLLSRGLIKHDSIIADSKSGVSGAGRKLSLRTHFVETNENLAPYNVGRVHRHVGEMEQEASKLAGETARIIFSPHLTPMNQGIVSTLYVDLIGDITTEQIMNAYKEDYNDETFIRVVDHLPESAFVRNTNYADVHAEVVEGTGRAILVCAIDNVVKGAYGQMLQCMNIVMGIDETDGLPL
jgi:N-acetyl-gamma-glutamyl-phosphate reductase